MNRFLALLALLAVIAIIPACGGGVGTTTLLDLSVSTFPLKQAVQARILAGSSDSFTATAAISGLCNGTATVVDTQPVATTFEGQVAFSVTETITVNFPDCTPSVIGSIVVNYMDSNYVPIGFTSGGTVYGVISNNATYPDTVKVGDSGTYMTANLFSDSSKTVPTGTSVTTYVVKPRDQTTAFLETTTTNYNTVNAPTFVTESVFILAATGGVTLFSGSATSTGDPSIVLKK